MPLLDTNLITGNQMMPQGPGSPQVPNLPPSLAQQIAQRAQMRRGMQGNPLMMATMGAGQQGGLPEQFPAFQPSPMPKPSEAYGQMNAPPDSMRMNALSQSANPGIGNVGLPGQLPQMGGPQIPDKMEGLGLGATAPQTFNPPRPPMMGPMAGAQMGPMGTPGGPPGMGAPGGGSPDMGDLRSQLFKQYLNLYPEGVI